MTKGIKSRLVIASVAMVALATFGYWYFLSQHNRRPLFSNTYGTEFGSQWHWYMDPWPISDADGTKVFVDYLENELCIVSDPRGENGWVLGGYKPKGRDIMIDGRWIEMPKSPDHCVFVDESGSQIVQVLRPGEAKELFDRFAPLRATGKLWNSIESDIPAILQKERKEKGMETGVSSSTQGR